MIESFKPGAIPFSLVNHELQLFIIHRVAIVAVRGRFAGPGRATDSGYFSSGGLDQRRHRQDHTPASSGKVSWACLPMSSKLFETGIILSCHS